METDDARGDSEDCVLPNLQAQLGREFGEGMKDWIYLEVFTLDKKFAEVLRVLARYALRIAGACYRSSERRLLHNFTFNSGHC